MKKLITILIILLAAGLTSSRAQNTWIQKADFGGIARSSAATFSIGDKGYLGTGGTPTLSALFKDFWEYDPATDVWSQKADFGGGERAAAVGLSINGKGYIGTGFSDSFWGIYYNDFWEYDPITNAWTKKADFGGVPRSEAGGFSLGNKGYIGTGFTYTIYEYYSDFWEYDPVSDVWTKKADFAGGGWADPAAFSIGNKGYMGTGWKNGLSASFYEYDPTIDTWTEKANFGGGAIQYSVGFSIGNKGYIGTGVGSAIFYEYDPALDKWTKKADYGGGGVNVAAGFSIGNKGYIGTGQTNVALKSFWEYTPDCNAGTTVYFDADADGYGDASNSLFVADCVAPIGYAYNSTDCNDANASIHPDACDASNGNGIDDNCDGVVDNGFGATTYYADADGDGYGAGSGTTLCSNPGTGYSIVNNDCDETNAAIHPGAIEIMNGIDDDCNGVIDDIAQNIWIQKANFGGAARSAAVGFSIGDKGYIGTGLGSTLYKDFWEYDVTTDVWTQKANYGGKAMHGGAGFAIGNKGYIGLGGNLSGGVYKDFWEYDPTSNTWTKKADFGGSARYAVISLSIANKGYIGAGFSWQVSGNYPKDFWEYDPATDLWMQKADFGGGKRQFASSFAIGTKGYAGTGTADGNLYKDFWEYNPDTNTWIQKADFGGTARYLAAGFSIGNKGYMGTGSYSYYKDFWEYDPSIDNWTQKADYGGGGVYTPVGFSINGKGYLGTGENGANYKGFWEYTPGSGTTLCEAPSGETTINITSTTAELIWNDVTAALGYVIKYNTEAENNKAKVTYSKSNSKPISGLTPNTNYFWKVKSVCSDDPKIVSDWSEKYFFTAAPFKIGDDQSNSLTLYPNPVSQQFTLNIESGSTTNQSASIHLLNVLGQTIYSSQEIVNGELTKVITMPGTAASGWYLVRVVMSDQVIENRLLYQK